MARTRFASSSWVQMLPICRAENKSGTKKGKVLSTMTGAPWRGLSTSKSSTVCLLFLELVTFGRTTTLGALITKSCTTLGGGGAGITMLSTFAKLRGNAPPAANFRSDRAPDSESEGGEDIGEAKREHEDAGENTGQLTTFVFQELRIRFSNSFQEDRSFPYPVVPAPRGHSHATRLRLVTSSRLVYKFNIDASKSHNQKYRFL